MFRCPAVGYVTWPVMVMSGWPEESWPRVFSVGPGPRMTYGTGTSTATARAAITPIEAISSVSERRDISFLSRSADPLVRPVGEPLVLPDRHRGLQLVDQLPARVERLGPVRGGHRGHHGQVADGQVTDPVHDRHPQDRELLRDRRGDPAQLGLGGRVRGVGQARDVMVMVVVADRADEQRNAADGVALDGGADLVHRQLRLADGDQGHGIFRSVPGAHDLTVPGQESGRRWRRARRTMAAV